MRDDLSKKLARALNRVDRPGSFCASGGATAVLPGLEVEGMGPVGLPLTPAQAKQLKTHGQQAPYGKGEETVVDTRVRRVWRIEPGQFSLTNPEWGPFLAETVGKVQEELGLEKQALEPHLYDLLLYEPGGFFLPHRDGEKLDRMVATLVVVLPSSHEGGEIVVRHDGQERTIDFRDDENSPFRIHFAAFYADCEHEIRPLRKGYRLCLVYNLTLAKSESKTKTPLTAPRDSEHIEAIVPLLREWAAADSAEKLVITLAHRYTQDGLAWDALKGVDRAKARVLDEAARRSGCLAYLGLLTFWESGSAEYSGGRRSSYGSGRRRRWGGYDDDYESDDASLYEMEEVFDTSLTANQWTDREGNGLPIGELDVEKDELLNPESLEKVDPEVQFEGYTGNEGMTLERWYRHAAIFLWPERRHFEMICGRDGRDVVPVLETLVSRWQVAAADEAVTLKAKCLELAAAVVGKWGASDSASRRVRYSTEPSQPVDLLKILAVLGDPGLIGAYLGGVLVRDDTAEPGASLVPLCQEHGWETFQRPLLAVMSATSLGTIERNVRLLEQVCLARPRKKKGWGELCAALAQGLVAAIEALDRERSAGHWRFRKADRSGVLAGLVRSLLATGQDETLSRLLAHTLANLETYPLRLAHMPALASLGPWLKKNVKQPSPALSRWLASCREQLEALTANLPQEPTDFRRAADVTCKCAECDELNRFLADPRESEHRFRVKEERRKHLQLSIREGECDLNFTTERTGSPHTLVCTKTTASYQARLKIYHEDQKHLTMVRSIEASLPG